MTDGCSSETRKIEKIFDFVQSLRYVAIELGQGGYVPSRPGVVLRRMYGDCKDKSMREFVEKMRNASDEMILLSEKRRNSGN